MGKQIIFFQGGGGQEDYDEDAKLVSSLSHELGPAYGIHYPFLPNEDAPDFGRRQQIGREISASEEDVILAAHSLGASMLLVYLSENKASKKIKGIILMATPFWSGNEDWVEPLKLQPDFANKLDKEIPLFFYHCHDDEVIPFDHFTIYQQELPWATFRDVPFGGHQFDNNLAIVANDIKSI